MTCRITDEHKASFERDGVVHVPGAVSPEWVARMTSVIDRQMAAPSNWANDVNAGNRVDRFFTDRYQWRDNPDIRAYIFETDLAAMAGALMGASTVRFYFDHMLVKEPGTVAPTPWHQDLPYWPFLGRQVCSAWVALTPCDVSTSAMEFVRGSHAWGRYFKPEIFGDDDANPNQWQKDAQAEGEAMPDIEAERAAYDIIGFSVQPGDALVFSAWTLHGARGNASADQRRMAISTRWLGDDATWYPHAGADPTVTQADVSIAPGEPARDDDRFPVVWAAGGCGTHQGAPGPD
ncbi:MAG: phytanoyl-CoA dioxygenase family protein [Gammaproteobacteria bacterium]|nr:phytanoyl-CoA dioxygenase family protein [Gammaproteobacteria bacterium]NNL99362.1 phytanoyl-CoA dioxygenase family protein [Gammaproteobacteria bacterium]